MGRKKKSSPAEEPKNIINLEDIKEIEEVESIELSDVVEQVEIVKEKKSPKGEIPSKYIKFLNKGEI